LALNPDFIIILNLLVQSFCNLFFICWCMLSLSSVHRYMYVFPCSSSCISLLKPSIKFCEWTNCPFSSTIFAQFSNFGVKIQYGYHHWSSNYWHLFFNFFLCFTYQPCQLSAITLSLLSVFHMQYSACSNAVLGRLS
jgi:hypothetical protein